MPDARTRHLLRFEHRLVAAANEMDEHLVAADEQQEYAPEREHLMEAVAIGQEALTDLGEDEEFYELYRQALANRVKYANQYQTIVDDPDVYEDFVGLERDIMLKGGVTSHLAEEVGKRFCHVLQDARMVKTEVGELRQEVHDLQAGMADLANTMSEPQARVQPRSRTKERLKAVCIALVGGALVGLNNGLIAATVGLSGAASAVSSNCGGAIIGYAVTKFAQAKDESGRQARPTGPSK